MDIGEFAGACREMAGRARAGLARDAAEEAARDLVAVLRTVTPKRSGALADSEIVNSVQGGGEVATANYGPHKIYDRFRNDGGTIHARNHPVLGNPDVGWFGKSVTQRGAHYMERGEAAGKGPAEAACRMVLDKYLTL